MPLWVVGAVINIIGSILINLGTNVIKLGHTRTATLAEGPLPKLLRVPRQWWHTPGNKMWLTGMAAFSVGNLLNFASFAFAAQSLLSALGVVQFLSNIVFGRFVNKEKVTKRVLFATAVVCVGCVLLVLFGNHESPSLSTHDMLELYSSAPYIVYLCFIFTTAPAMYWVYRRGKRAVLADTTGAAAKKWARWLPISYALFAGLLGTQSVLYGKTMSMLLRTTFSGDSQFDQWYAYLSISLFLLFAGFWMSRYSKAMKLFPVLIIMPIIQIVWVLFSIISGSLYYQEYKTLTALSGSMFGLGVAVLLLGVYLLTGGKPMPQQPVRRGLKSEIELTEEERERGEELDQAALRTKTPLSDNLDALLNVSTAAAVLEPEEALVARKLSTIYDRQGAQSLHALGTLGAAAAPASARGARPGSAPMPRGQVWAGHGGGSAGEESQAHLVLAGAKDSALSDGLDTSPWRGANGTPPSVSSARVATAGALRGSRVEGKPASQAVGGGGSEGSDLESGLRGQPAAGATPPGPASLMHDLRTDWGVGMRDLSAVMRASVGLPQDDDEGTAFSIWSMPMPCNTSFTTAGRARSLELPPGRDTFRIRSALEQQAGTRSGGGATPHTAATTDDQFSSPNTRPQRPGHRRINRSRSANELDDMLCAAALGEEVDVLGPSPGFSPAAGSGEGDGESLGSTWRPASSATTVAAGAGAGGAAAGGEVSSRRSGLAAAAHHWPHPFSESAPQLSAVALGRGPLTPPAVALAGGSMQLPSAPGSAPRRPWAAEAMASLSPTFSQGSYVDESEGAGVGSPPLPPREGGVPVSAFLSPMSLSPPGSESSMGLASARARQQAGKKGDKAS